MARPRFTHEALAEPAFTTGSVFYISVMATEVDPARVMPHAILQAADSQDVRILEVGAGDGPLTFQSASQPRSVIGIDTIELDIRSLASQDQVDYHRSITKEAYE